MGRGEEPMERVGKDLGKGRELAECRMYSGIRTLKDCTCNGNRVIKETQLGLWSTLHWMSLLYIKESCQGF